MDLRSKSLFNITEMLIGVANDFDDADDMAIGFVVGYGEYGEYGDVTPTDYWEEDDNDCGHEYSCTNSKLHPYNNLCDITYKVVIHGVKAITHDVKAIAIAHGVESIAHVLFEVSGNLNLAAASSIADFFVFSGSADSIILVLKKRG
nr:1413_t:CDS:2 [Entrophospora candida]